MHFTYFTVKRTYLRCLHKVQKPLLERFGLTPARFDLLYVLTKISRVSTIRQSAIWKALGVSRPTVSKMLNSLEELGLVARMGEEYWDARQVRVWLTTAGRKLMKHAMKWLRMGKRGPLSRTTHSLFVEKWWSTAACLHELERMEAYFRRLRDVVMDPATLYYPWHPAG